MCECRKQKANKCVLFWRGCWKTSHFRQRGTYVRKLGLKPGPNNHFSLNLDGAIILGARADQNPRGSPNKSTVSIWCSSFKCVYTEHMSPQRPDRQTHPLTFPGNDPGLFSLAGACVCAREWEWGGVTKSPVKGGACARWNQLFWFRSKTRSYPNWLETATYFGLSAGEKTLWQMLDVWVTCLPTVTSQPWAFRTNNWMDRWLWLFFSFCRDILGHSSEKHEGLRQIRSQGAKINKRPSHLTDTEKSLSVSVADKIIWHLQWTVHQLDSCCAAGR